MQEKQVSKSPLLVQSHRTHFILLTVSCVNKLWNLSTREVHLRLSAQGFIGVGHIGSLCLALLTFQTLQRKDIHGKPRCLYKELRHSEPHLSGNGGNSLKPKFPEASTPDLSSWAFLSWQSQLLCQLFSAHSLAPHVSPYQAVSGSKSQNSSFFSPTLPSEILNWFHWGLSKVQLQRLIMLFLKLGNWEKSLRQVPPTYTFLRVREVVCAWAQMVRLRQN